MAANKIKGLTIEINGETSGLDSALSGVNKKSKSLQSELREVEKLLKFDPGNTELLAQKQDLLAQSVENAKEKLDTLKTAAEQASEKLANGDIGEDQYRALQREVIKAEQNLEKLTTQQSELGSESAQAGKDVKNLSDDLDDAGDSALSFGDVLKANVIGDAIVDGVKQLGSAIKDVAIDTNSSAGMIQAKLGLTKDAAEDLTAVAQSVWADGFGESVTDVASNLATVRQYLGDMAEDDLGAVLEKAYTLSDVFGADVPESMKSVKTMMDNFGVSADEAFDLITRGYQNGLDYSGEFLDTLNEYSPQFKSMGLSAQDAMNLLIAGADNGAFSLDKVADAMKEFNLRIKDGSSSTTEGLQLLGLNASEITKKLSDGSMTTADAMQQVITALQNTDDKVTQNLAGVDLFGTQWEDVGSTVVLSLGGVEDKLGTVAGATDEASKAAQDNLGSKFQTAVRGLQDALAPLAEKLLDLVNNIMPGLQTAIQWLIDHGPELISVLAGVGTAFAAIKIEGLVTSLGSLPDVLSKLSGALPALGTAISSIGTAISSIGAGTWVGVILGIVAALITLWNTNEGFRDAVMTAWTAIKDTVSGVVDAIVGFFTETIPGAVQGVIGWFAALPGNIASAISGVITSLGEWAASIGQWVAEAIPTVIENIVTFFTELPEKIGYAIGYALGTLASWAADIGSWVVENVPKIIDSIITFFKELPGKIWGAIVGAVQKLGEWAAQLIAWAKTSIPQIISSIITFFKELPGKIWGAIVGAVQKLGEWASNMAAKAAEVVPGIIRDIVSFFEDLPKKLLDVGVNAIKGLWEGIKSMSSWLAGKVKEFVTGVKDGFNRAFDSHSPSRVMRDEVGVYVSQGLAAGIDKGAPAVLASIQNVTDKALKTAQALNDELLDEEERLTKELSKSDITDVVKDNLNAQLDAVKEFQQAYKSALDDIQKSQDSMAKKLEAYGDLFKSVQGDAGSYLELSDLQSEIDQITNYSDQLEDLRTRGIPETLMDEITSMGIDDALGYTEKLLAMSDDEYDEYIALWTKKQQLAKDTAAKFYSNNFSALTSEYMQKAGITAANSLARGLTDSAGVVVDAAQGIVSNVTKVFSGIAYDPSANYMEQIAAAKLAGDEAKAAELEQIRNAKIDGEGLSWAKTYDFTQLSGALNTLAANAAYATAPVSSETTQQDTANTIAAIVGQALLDGLTEIGDKIFDAIPKQTTFELNGHELAKTSWDDYDLEGRRRSRIYAPSREQIASIAMSVMPKLSTT